MADGPALATPLGARAAARHAARRGWAGRGGSAEQHGGRRGRGATKDRPPPAPRPHPTPRAPPRTRSRARPRPTSQRQPASVPLSERPLLSVRVSSFLHFISVSQDVIALLL